ncbi:MULTISPECIES: hypothetical protein [unclassified Luteimonas]
MATDTRNERENILANIHQHWQGTYQPGSVDYSAWRRLEPALVADLLDNAPVAARHDARRLLADLQQHPWRILSAQGGKGAEGLQLTLQLKGRQVQLQCSDSPALRVVGITG